MEISCDKLYKQAHIRGFLHLYDGQEAVAVGHDAAVNNKEDCFIGAYRIHGWAYLRGFSVKEIIAEMMGKYTGASDGKGGSMHYYKKATQFYGGHGIVGDQASCVVGLAFGKKYLGHKGIATGSFGDGGANQGQMAEGMNMAKLWNLPVVYLLENNLYAMGTSTIRAANNTDFYKRYDKIPGLRVDGFNVLAVRETMKFAKKFAQKNGPIFIEAMTYRYHGHSMSDPGVSYRSREEIMGVRKDFDCITQLKKMILDNKLLSEEEVKKLEAEAKKTVDDAAAASMKDDEPPVSELYTDITNDPVGSSTNFSIFYKTLSSFHSSPQL
jgi:pyruvate dehydrogenase E1 component alpha subunit